MAEKDWIVSVAVRADLSIDDMVKAQQLPGFQSVSDTRRRSGLRDNQRMWTFTVSASDIWDAGGKARPIVTDAFTDLDPDAKMLVVAGYPD